MASPDSQLLRVQGLDAGYGESCVLAGLELALPLGQVSVIVGPGGSGKTTFLRALGDWRGATFWWRGEITRPAAARLQAQWQGAPAAAASLPSLILASHPSEEDDPAAARRRAREVVADVWSAVPDGRRALEMALELPTDDVEAWHRRLARLTGSLAMPADLRLLDEPAVDAPPAAIGWIAQLLRRPTETTTVLITHHLKFARLAAEHVVFMVGGELVESNAAAAFFAQPRRARSRDFLRYGS